MLHITPLERQALQLLAEGKTGADVAAQWGTTELETSVLLTALFARMGARGQAEALALADRRGLLTCSCAGMPEVA